MRTRRGISPLIGSVLLVAIVMAIAGILSGWVNPLVERQGDQIRDNADQQITCANAGLYISDATFRNDTDEVTVAVRNSGTVDLGNVSVHLFRDTSVLGTGYVSNLAAGGNAKTTVFSYTEFTPPDRAVATSADCPSVQAETGTFPTP